MRDDLISRRQAIDALHMHLMYRMGTDSNKKRLDEWINSLPSTQPEPQHGRIFQEIVVEHPSISTYTEYEGKPYFSIKYTENGQEFIGYGTYKPEVLSGYLKDYFMPSAQPDRSLWFRIGEVCVGESKGDISAEMAVEKIRELLREAERREK